MLRLCGEFCKLRWEADRFSAMPYDASPPSGQGNQPIPRSRRLPPPSGWASAASESLDFPPDAEWFDDSDLDTAAPLPGRNRIEDEIESRPSFTSTPLKSRAISLLRATIRGLEGVVQRLELEPNEKQDFLPARQRRRAAFNRVGHQARDFGVTARAAAIEIGDWLRDRLQPRWQSLHRWWLGLLTTLRVWLPDAVNEQVSDGILTGAIALLIVAGVWLTNGLLAATPKAAAVVSRSEPSPSMPIPIANSSPSPPAATVPTGDRLPAPSSSPLASPLTPSLPQPSPAPESPLSAPARPEPSSSPASLPEFEPEPILSLPKASAIATSPTEAFQRPPEQPVIARIQEEVMAISDQYKPGLLQSVEANFRHSLLVVRVSSSWYTLPRDRQDQFANDLLRRATDLDFIRLELVDDERQLLARSPVIGDEMVVLRRQSSSSQPMMTEPLAPSTAENEQANQSARIP